FIEEKRVIPIVGPELLKVETPAGPRLLYDWMAEKLAVKLNVDTSKLPAPYSLNDVVCWFLSSRGRREDTYTRMRSVLREVDFPAPAALRKLAQITDFDLFITTTFDQYLEQAINAERFDGAASTEVIAYDHSDGDERLMAFLQQVSVRTRVYSGAEQFVNELHSRWLARRRVTEKPADASGPQRFLPPEREMPENAVFISYAREDLPAV